MSHTSLTYHLVFGTYRRANVILIPHERELYKYMYDFAVNRGALVRWIGGCLTMCTCSATSLLR